MRIICGSTYYPIQTLSLTPRREIKGKDNACFVVPIPYFSYRYRQLEARLDGCIDNITSPWKRPYYQAGPDKHEPSLLCLTCTWTPVLPIEYEFRVLPIAQSSAAPSSNATCCSALPLPSRHSKTPPVIPSASCPPSSWPCRAAKSTDAHTASGGNGTGSAQIQASPVRPM